MLKLILARVCFSQSQTFQHWLGVAFVDTEPRRLRFFFISRTKNKGIPKDQSIFLSFHWKFYQQYLWPLHESHWLLETPRTSLETEDVSEDGTSGTAQAPPVVLPPRGLSLTDELSVSLSRGPLTIDDEPLDTTRYFQTRNSCPSRIVPTRGVESTR